MVRDAVLAIPAPRSADTRWATWTERTHRFGCWWQGPGVAGRPGSGRELSGTAQGGSHGMAMGDVGGVYVFVCRACPRWPTIHRYDC